jgi:hypothetical protein
MERSEEQLGTRDLATTERGDTEAPAREQAAEREAATAPDSGAGDESEGATLLPDDESEEFGRRWEELQTGFVDEPRRTVEDADALVASVMQRVADGFARERERLEEQWDRGEDVSTEDLRVALQRYRSFFRRLLSA